MEIRKVKVSEIKAARYNPRKDLQPNDEEYQKLKRSIEKFGYIDPIIWNKRTGNLVGGHQRFKILLESGAEEVDVSVVDLDDVTEKAANIALNKISGEWDFSKLKELLVELDTGDFDLSLTGFNDEELKKMIDFDGITPEDKYPEMEIQPFEHYDYIVIFFRNSMDFLNACEKFGIKKVMAKDIKRGKIGLGRVVDGSRILGKKK